MLNKNDFKIFNIFLFFWLALGWFVFILTLAGVFYWWILAGFVALIIALGARFFLELLFKISRTFLIANLFLLAIVVIFSIYISPTVFSGRDQGSISEAAIRLSQNNQLEFSTSVSEDFFEINSTPRKKMSACLTERNIVQDNAVSLKEKIEKFYCHVFSSGKALNFPGFFYTPNGNLVTQFPLVYISWLSFFYSFLGLTGFIIANAILFYIFLLSMFLLSYKLAKGSGGNKNKSLYIPIATLLITITSFSFAWFLKFTLTENMALTLLWVGIFQVICLTQTKLKNLSGKKINLLLLFMSFGLLMFTRIEGIAFFISMLIVLLFYKNTASYFRRNFLKIVLPIIILFSIFFIWNLIVDIYFYKAILKSFVKDFAKDTSIINSSYVVSTLNLFKIFALYGILAPLLLGILSVIYFLRRKNYQKLIPFFIISPALIYIFSPQITPDHPWMLRRFVFAVLPVSILYTTVLLSDILKIKNGQWRVTLYKIILAIVVALNILAFTHFFTYLPGKNLLEETEKISQHFTENDLILIDKKTNNVNRQMIGAPLNFLFDKNAVYFFNPDDFKKINTQKYDKIYLISPKNNIEYYRTSFLGDKLIFFSDYSIKTNILVENLNEISLPIKKSITTTGTIFEIKK